MTRQQWKDTLEGVGVIAIISSLIFVGIETRNSTKQAILTTQALEISAYQELMTNIEELNTISIQDDTVASVMAKFWGETGDSDAFREKRAFFLLFRHGDMAFYMYQRGAIDENRLRSALGPIQFSNQLVKNLWNENRSVFSEDYQAYIEKIMTTAN
jgi:hypothetical protein